MINKINQNSVSAKSYDYIVLWIKKTYNFVLWKNNFQNKGTGKKHLDKNKIKFDFSV